MKRDPFSLYVHPSRRLRIRKQAISEIEPLATGDMGLRLPSERFSWASLVVIAICCVVFVCTRVVYLQIVQGHEFYSRSEGNRIENERVVPLRGSIVDHTGAALVNNIANFQLLLDGMHIAKDAQAQSVYDVVSPYLTIAQDEFNAAFEKARTERTEIIVEENIPYDKALYVMSRTRDMLQMRVNVSYRREYVYGESLGHVLGYEGKMTEAEYALLKKNGYALNDEVGKTGIEKVYESVLRGTPGETRIEVDNQGRARNIVSTTDPVIGSELHLGIDIGLQNTLYASLKTYIDKEGLPGGSAVALDPRDGSVRALVSYPGYNNNDFIGGISQEAYSGYTSNEHNPLFHRAVSGEYPSGSTIKPVVAAGALDSGVITPSTTVNSVGGVSVGGARFLDWKLPGGHGLTNVYKAIYESVNTFFYMVGGGLPDSNAKSLGVDGIDEYASRFGLGKPTGIDVPGEGDGFLPTPEWKEEFKNEQWFLGDTYHLSIGQGDLLVTPLQVANYTASFANGGTLYQPHIVEAVTNMSTQETTPVKPTILNNSMVSASAIQVVRDAMHQTVLNGTARSLQSLPVSAAGKTGTAQFGDNTKEHSWFTSFAPFETPELVVTVLVESGGEGNEAALPIAKEALQYYFSRVTQ